MHATQRIGQAIRTLRQLKAEIENAWPHYADRPEEAKAVEVTIETCLVDLERSAHVEAPELDRLVERTTAIVASQR